MPFVANVAGKKEDGESADDQAPVSSLRVSRRSSIAMTTVRPTEAHRSQRFPRSCTEAGTAVAAVVAVAAAAWKPDSGEWELR